MTDTASENASPDTVGPPASTPAKRTWGQPQCAPARWSTRQLLAAVGVAAVLAVAGAVVIHVADTGPITDQQGPPALGPPRAMGADPLADALHVEFVVPDGLGGFRTELTQTGVITAISTDAITARSADKFTGSYTITADTRTEPATPKLGDTVTIRAVDHGEGPIASDIAAPASS